MSWTDFGYCNIAATDLNGEFTLSINEAYKNKQKISEFINIASEYGLQINEVDSFKYYRVDSIK